MTTNPTMPIKPVLTTFEEFTAITDPLYRAIIGLDTTAKPLFDSAWATESPSFTTFQGTMTGKSALDSGLWTHVTSLDTTHAISNVRILSLGEDRKSASFMTYVYAQHLRGGEGMQVSKEGRGNVLTGGHYFIDVVLEDGLWRMKKWEIKVLWLEGDMSVVAPPARS